VQVAALLALRRGYRAGIGTTTDEDGWPIIYIELPDAILAAPGQLARPSVS
jgi:hypothetical protein